jgi:hypothetical protein
MADNFLLVCESCWREVVAHTHTGCYVCQTCVDCTPTAGRCLDCRDMRAEDIADRTRRYAVENEVTC